MFVSRQNQYYSRLSLVEVAETLDSSGPDMLVEKWKNLGEGTEFDSAVEAVQAAIAIAKAWQQADGHRHPISVQGKLAGEMGMESEPITRKDALKWAQKFEASRPKCSHCGKAMPENKREWFYPCEFGEEEFACCCEQCAEQEWEAQVIADRRCAIADILVAMKPGQTDQFGEDEVTRLACDCGDCYTINEDPKRYCLISATDFLMIEN